MTDQSTNFAAPYAVRIDVGLLATAMLNVLGSSPVDTGDAGVLFARLIAQAIADEYERLAAHVSVPN